MSQNVFSLAFGVGTQNRDGAWLEVFYAQPLLNPSAELIAAITPVLNYAGGNQTIAFTPSQARSLADALRGRAGRRERSDSDGPANPSG